MQINFDSKRVLISGSTAGIGLATARSFLASGAQVVINGRSAASVERGLQRLGAHPRATGFAGDLSQPAAAEQLARQHAHFDIVINNLGIFGPQDFFETPDDQWDHFFQTNVMSGVRLSRLYAPGMVRQGWGRIVFIASESALNVPSDMIHYGMTKTAQLSVSRGLAKRLAGTGVTVNAVLPGPTLSEGVVEMLKPEMNRTDTNAEQVAAAFIKAHRASSIIQRAATVEEVANMILYVSSEQASATTGAALRVDGGVVDTIA